MDSMLGYKNDKYLYFGRCAAKLDDVANYIPARLSGWLMVAASAFVKMDVKNAAKPLSKRGWDCMHSSSNLLAGYPHIYYYGNPQIPRAFLMKCLEYHNKEF